MKLKLFTLFILATFFVASPLYAQSQKHKKHTYVYHAAPNESMEQAKRNAISRAKVEALREEFGTIISGANATSLISKNNITTSKFASLSSEGEVNGEWIGDTEEPKTEVVLDGSSFIVTATVNGKIQELTNNPIPFEAKILRNTPDSRYESSEFMAGDDLFVSFLSPVDGYLAIYLLDGENAYCLLPYANSQGGAFPITHGKEYILFSPKKYSEGENPQIIDEYTLTADGSFQELNQLYFIFSPNKFSKNVDRFKQREDGNVYPRVQTWGAFQQWIIRTRRKDKEMAVQTKYVVISPRE